MREGENTSYSISTLLIRNLHDVFGENDPARRRAAIDEIFTEDCVCYEPRGAYRGRDEIDRVAGAIKATRPGFRYQPIAGPEETGNGGRIRWVSGRPGEAAAYAGTDFTISRDGRIAALISFSTSYPELDSAALWPSCGRSLENGFCRRVLPVESWLLRSGQSFERDREESSQ